MPWRLIASKAALWAALSALGVLLLTWLRFDAKRDQRRKSQLEDYEHAEDINARVSDNRADPERLRKYDDAGWRD